MKKSKVLMLVLVVLLTCCLSLAMIACRPTDDNDAEIFKFILTEDGTEFNIYLADAVEKNDIKEIVIPATYNGKPVTGIGDRAFYGCSGLKSITIPNSVTSIGNSAFYGCSIEVATMPTIAIDYIPKDKLKTVVLTSGESIGNYAFSDCSSLTNITIANSVTSIGSDAFRGCSGLTSVTIPNSVTSIGSDAFAWCSGITRIIIPDSVTNISNGAFSACPIESATMPTIAIDYIPKDKLKTAVLTSGESIGNHAFYGCSGLTNIIIPDSVTSIGDDAFYGCSGLESITIPNSVISVGYDAFYGCSGLESIVVDSGNQTYKSEGNCLLTKDGKTLILGCKNSVIPYSVTSIGNHAFSGCSGLTNIIIPDSVTSIGEGVFYGCSGLESIVVDSGNQAYKSEGNCLLTKDGTTLILGCKNSVIPYSVTSIGNHAFSGCSSLTSIAIPDSVTRIGDFAFTGCSALTSVTIGVNMASIDGYVFWDCSGLKTINFEGTKAEWNAISKGFNWNFKTGNYTIICTDGTLDKDGNEIE